jgi:prevent-host-death family protein
MTEIGVRELKIHASDIVRAVHDQRARYVITRRGKAVAVLSPVEPAGLALQTTPDASAWGELTRLGKQIGRRWRSPLSSTELLASMRR